MSDFYQDLRVKIYTILFVQHNAWCVARYSQFSTDSFKVQLIEQVQALIPGALKEHTYSALCVIKEAATLG